MDLPCQSHSNSLERVYGRPGPLPHPLAASTDISKVIRMDYGPDEDYLTAMETSSGP